MLFSNRKLHMDFQLVPNWVTLNGAVAIITLISHKQQILEPTASNLLKLSAVKM